MRKFFIAGFILFILLLMAGRASAWYKCEPYHRGHFHFGVFIGPPVIFLPPPAPPPVRFYYYRVYPPPDYYECDRYDRVWVPGHWEWRRGPCGWERIWVPGHWEWRWR